MHKAKGLEFDTVILPGLQRTMRADETALLRWLDRPTEAGVDLLMAALAATGSDSDPIYSYVGELSRQQRAAEQLRQLYVATTRPKQRLHLIGQVSIGKEGVNRPPTGSLLRAMWAVVEGEFQAAAENAVVPEGGSESAPRVPAQRFRRLPADWMPPELPVPSAPRALSAPSATDAYRPFDWAGQTTRMVGIVVHRLLMRIAEDGIEHYAEPLLDWAPGGQPPKGSVVDARIEARRATRIATLWPAAEALFERGGLSATERADALAQVKDTIGRTLVDPVGRWILSPHAGAVSEHALTVATTPGPQSLRLDRAFTAGGTRWIVDFKASTLAGSNVDEFLADQRQRYAGQLKRYADALAANPGAPVRTALYFPRLGRFET
jgi:ATP-dependent helicase/nuclease subunit A